MSMPPTVVDDGRTVTVKVPLSIRKRGGRKIVLAPDGAEVNAAPIGRYVDNAMIKAVARAFRWREMLESGEYATIREIARAEKVNESYVSRVLRLTLLSPDLIERILGGHLSVGLKLDRLVKSFPLDWKNQLGTLI
jgi:hypothetical protein